MKTEDIKDEGQYELTLEKRLLTPAAFGGLWLHPLNKNIVSGDLLKAILSTDEGVKINGYTEV